MTKEFISISSRMMERVAEADLRAGDCEVFTFDVDRVEGSRQDLWADSELEAVADLLTPAGSPARLRSLLPLAIGELCVCDLAQVLGLS
ncbi:MAG: hypothetical protein RLP09_18225, partial [Sandaracinaceae bacterium]